MVEKVQLFDDVVKALESYSADFKIVDCDNEEWYEKYIDLTLAGGNIVFSFIFDEDKKLYFVAESERDNCFLPARYVKRTFDEELCLYDEHANLLATFLVAVRS